jgi:phosphomannomutase
VEALGADVVAIHTTADGHFPRPAEPIARNLTALSAAVAAEGADVGFAQDMDGDRLAIVDESGSAIGEELTIVLAAEQVLAHTPGPVTVNVATTGAVEEMAGRYGCPVTRTRVGEANVAEGMRLSAAVIGGEGNGGVIYPRINFARDSLVGMALVLHRLAETGQAVSELAGRYGRFHVVKLQRHSPAEQARALLERAREAWAGQPVDTLDGVKVQTDTGWFIIRPSNTEPLVRVIAEAPTEAGARGLAEEAMARLGSWLAEPADQEGRDGR